MCIVQSVYTRCAVLLLNWNYWIISPAIQSFNKASDYRYQPLNHLWSTHIFQYSIFSSKVWWNCKNVCFSIHQPATKPTWICGSTYFSICSSCFFFLAKNRMILNNRMANFEWMKPMKIATIFLSWNVIEVMTMEPPYWLLPDATLWHFDSCFVASHEQIFT